MNKIILSLAGFSLLIAGCGAGMGDMPGAQGTISRTIVRLRADGSSEVTRDQITEEQQRAEIATREQMLRRQTTNNSSTETLSQGIGADPSCGVADLWLFDGYNQTGTNELCLIGAGDAHLRDFTRLICNRYSCFLLDWEFAVRSFWAGVQGGHFALWNGGGSHTFFPWQREDVADHVAQNSIGVWLY